MPETSKNFIENGHPSDNSGFQITYKSNETVSNLHSVLLDHEIETVEEQPEFQQDFEKVNTRMHKKAISLQLHSAAGEPVLARGATKNEDTLNKLLRVDEMNNASKKISSGLLTFSEQVTCQCDDFDLDHRLTSSSRYWQCSSETSQATISGNESMLSRSTTKKWKRCKSVDSGKGCNIVDEKKNLKRLVTIQNDTMLGCNLPAIPAAENHIHAGPVKTKVAPVYETIYSSKQIPALQIVMLIVGTRGDVQPFIAIGKHLQDFGHRVRLATHSTFRQFVLDSGLEYFPLGGDPKVLAGYMIRNKGIIPSAPSELSIQWVEVKAIIDSVLPACTEADRESGAPFRAEAIIANPPAYGQVHVAEALQVPIHIFFTMPWTPTTEFPHPFSWIWNPAGYRLSYQMVDLLMWLGSRGLINEFRRKKLKLSAVTYLGGGSSLSRFSTLPTGYLWSPHLIPKPKDWGPLVDVMGFCFLNLGSKFEAPKALTDWLQSGKRPIYFGFGSLPIDDSQGMTKIIVQTLQQTHQRGIIDKGWGGMGTLILPSDFVYVVEDCPHDWLFPQCVAVVHHGGAGTTAAGLRAAVIN